ncbi:MAG: hypothetical protein JW850_19600 [Thermoflexales bacterium]|nr:hypothetical protein [Thermoflexales bacterium]
MKHNHSSPLGIFRSIRLNLGYRLAYKLAGAFKMVQRAHRIVSYQL